jgi:hypothetical protein
MATVMERGNEAPGTTVGPAVATPARLTTTLYDLLAVVQDVVGPEDDALVVATMVHLLHSGRLTGWGRHAHEKGGYRDSTRDWHHCNVRIHRTRGGGVYPGHTA